MLEVRVTGSVRVGDAGDARVGMVSVGVGTSVGTGAETGCPLTVSMTSFMQHYYNHTRKMKSIERISQSHLQNWKKEKKFMKWKQF